MNKEQIYDQSIAPLMTEIINLCKANNIAMLASFSIPKDDDPDLLCTTALLGDESEPPEVFLRASSIIRGGGNRLGYRIENRTTGQTEVGVILD